ncbi:MAG TPA: hypothetical protein VFK30_01930 [Anaerolineae bacterium]|nr:hypothetical protein [Anaerolineae bacterium]
MDKWREALINYMVSVAICDGGDYVGFSPDTLEGKILEPLSEQETKQLLEEVDKRASEELDKD